MTPLIVSTAVAFSSFDKWRNCFVIGIPSKKRKTNKSCPVVALGTYHINISVSGKFWVVVNLLIPSDQFRYGTLKHLQPVFSTVLSVTSHIDSKLYVPASGTSSISCPPAWKHIRLTWPPKFVTVKQENTDKTLSWCGLTIQFLVNVSRFFFFIEMGFNIWPPYKRSFLQLWAEWCAPQLLINHSFLWNRLALFWKKRLMICICLW